MAEQTWVEKFGDMLIYGGRSAIDEHYGYRQEPSPSNVPVSETTTTGTPQGAAAPNANPALKFVSENQTGLLLGFGGVLAIAVMYKALS